MLDKNFYPGLLAFSLGLCVDISTDGFCPIEQIFVFSLFLSLFVLALQHLLRIIVQPPAKAAFLAVAIFLWIPCFACFNEALNRLLSVFTLPTVNQDICVIAYCAVGVIILVLCNAMPVSSFMTKSMNAIVIAFCALVLTKECPLVLAAEQNAVKAIAIMKKQNGNIKLNATIKPDIYYIILDSAACSDTLHNIYDMDNIKFLEYLKEKGFYIAEASKSNYDRTKFSLSSSLNLNYINCLTDLLPKNGDNQTIFCRLVQQSQLTNSLKTLGYNIINVRSSYPLTEHNLNADTNLGNIFGNQMVTALALEMTVLGGIESHSDFLGSIARIKQSWAFSHLNEVQQFKSPKFVFVHILLPHPPFLFTAEGKPLPLSSQLLSETYSKEKYSGQTIYTFRETQKMIDKLLSLSKNNLPIIIVQGDHGSRLFSDVWPYSQQYLKERFGILNAYFLPGIRHDVLYNSISPVNTFRLIFNQYFQGHLQLLPDISYYAPLAPPYYWTRWQNNSQLK